MAKTGKTGTKRKTAKRPKKSPPRKGAATRRPRTRRAGLPTTESAPQPAVVDVILEQVRPRRLARAVTQPPAGVTVAEGIDVSHHNGPVVWSDVVAAGQRYVFVKATEGVTVVDKRFAANWIDARAAGLPRGAYHYFRPQSSPIDQANHFFTVVGPLDRTDLPPVLDLEERTGWAGTPAARLQAVREFLRRVRDLSRRRPIVYTSRSFMNECLGASTALGEHALWVVDYGQSPPRMPAGWTDWTLWQHSEQGSVPGVSGAVDLNWFRGNLLALQRFISRSIVP